MKHDDVAPNSTGCRTARYEGRSTNAFSQTGGARYAYRPAPARPFGEETYIGIQDRRGSYGSDRYGADRYGADRYGSASRVVINDPDYAQYKLRKIFDENWTVSDSK